jgi:hypothetical protein
MKSIKKNQKFWGFFQVVVFTNVALLSSLASNTAKGKESKNAWRRNSA